MIFPISFQRRENYAQAAFTVNLLIDVLLQRAGARRRKN